MIETRRDQIKTKVMNIPLFKKVVDIEGAIDKIVDALEFRTVNKNEDIIKEGDAGNEMYILFEGEIEIAKFTMEKERYTVARLNDKMNIFFGELALVDSDKRSATVTALTPCTLLVFSRDQFHAIGTEMPFVGWKLGLEICSLLSGRLRKANEDAVVLFEALVNEIKAA